MSDSTLIHWFAEIDDENITIIKGESPIKDSYWKIKPVANNQKIYWTLISDDILMEEWDEDLLFSDIISAQNFCQREHDKMMNFTDTNLVKENKLHILDQETIYKMFKQD